MNAKQAGTIRFGILAARYRYQICLPNQSEVLTRLRSYDRDKWINPQAPLMVRAYGRTADKVRGIWNCKCEPEDAR